MSVSPPAAPGSVAITGMGVVCCLGDTVSGTFAALCSGRSGVAPLRAFRPELYRARHAYEIDDRPGRRDETLRATRWLVRAVRAAIADDGLLDDLGSVPVLVGTTLRELRSVELWWRDGHPFAPRDLHFGTALRDEFAATDTHTVCNACAASLYTLGLGADLITLGAAPAVVVAGVDAITESSYGLLDRANDRPPSALRPFERTRSGMLMGEGAAAAVLRRADAAPPNRVRAVVRAVALACDAQHPTAPDPKGIAAAIREGHRRASVAAEDVDLVMLHGSGTPLGDEAEAMGLTDVLGPSVRGPYMTAVKSMTGHTAGSSGLLSLIVAVESLRHGRVPPVVGLAEPIEAAREFRLVRGTAAAARLRLAQVNAFGFGGLNAVALVEMPAASEVA
ncbi:beta-ketoacyl synthase N-terminal-like domain-containing protein [Streptomyces cupreus]|uniref:3-oxoacyl-ACP synthase n=1 Tax=Streptomyces cupreus TaxID=2759956 RepID=A0A7X1M9X4_9ACTN|nr:beta-ketoacyl synthase N-terminal-like domain-containing protein [Streptomyces cupreus]MBC2903699.1 3-oxoacyl-ACP synthase [Streptomyces cupreus]